MDGPIPAGYSMFDVLIGVMRRPGNAPPPSKCVIYPSFASSTWPGSPSVVLNRPPSNEPPSNVSPTNEPPWITSAVMPSAAIFSVVIDPAASSCAVILFALKMSVNILFATTSESPPLPTSLDRSIPEMIASVSDTGSHSCPSQCHWPSTSPFTTRNH